MRKILVIAAILMFMAMPAFALKTANWVGGDFTASGYSDPILINGYFSISILFDGAGSVDLQRCRSNGVAATCAEDSTNWKTIDTYTVDIENTGLAAGPLIYYRLKFTVSSGTIAGELYQ